MRRRATGQRLVRWLFGKGLGVVYWIAFRSLRAQVLGLYGRRGILPVAELLDGVRAATGRERYRLVPSLLWLGARDADLVRLCDAGERCAAWLVAGAAPRAMTAALWALYLSFVSVGREFLGYQWDALLLEAGLAAILAAPPGLAPGVGAEEPPRAASALLRWLVFRLYFESGLCKLQSRDPTWRGCTACAYHYWTQPLPTPLAWWAHQLPRRAHRLSTALTIALECGAPFAAFAWRRARRLAFVALTAFQAAIEATGNYGFFNLLSAVLGLWLLDDAALARVVPTRALPPPRRARGWRRWGAALASVPLFALSGALLVGRLRRAPLPRPLVRLYRALAPLHAVSPYGLFAVMTTRRPEIVLEGSNDGVTWREYVCRYKPGPVAEPPRFVAPHQPRLDWQLWFAALAPLPPAWFARLMIRLLEGAPEVTALFASTPFAAAPPRYVRALLYEYEMTDAKTRRASGAWWRRTLRGVYFPACALARTSEDEAAARTPPGGGA